MKKVLIITYYWPPSGGSGVQRWVKFTKYLKIFGWEPIIYTVDNGEYPEIDLSLQKDIPEDTQIIKGKIVEPFTIYKKFVGKQKDDRLKVGVITESKKGSWKDKVALWIRSNLFIPDARMLWIYPSVKKLKLVLKDNPVDLIVSTGPPHSNHLIAHQLKKSLGIKWVADFRDPWTEIYYFNDLILTSWAKNTHQRLEKKVLQKADKIVVVGQGMKENFLKKGFSSEVITNGYDEDDFTEQVNKDSIFSIVHTGTIVQTNNHQVLWEAISELYENNDFKNFEIKLIGKVDPQLIADSQNFSYHDNIKISSYIPHSDIVKVQKAAHLLILLLEPTTPVVTGKVFEYLGSQSNILAIGSKKMNYEIYDIFENLANSVFCEMDEKDKIKDFIKKAYTGELNTDSPLTNLSRYTRKTLTKKMVEIFNSLT